MNTEKDLTNMNKQSVKTGKNFAWIWIFLIILIIPTFFCIICLFSMKKSLTTAQNQLDESQKKISILDESLKSAMEDNQTIEKQLEIAQRNLSSMEKTTNEMGKGFKLMSARDVKMLNLDFSQPVPTNKDDQAIVAQIIANTKSKTPVDFCNTCNKILGKRAALSRDLQLNPANGNVCDPIASIIEQAAKNMGFKASTRFSWDLSQKKHRIATTISDPSGKNKSAIFASFDKLITESTFQVSPKSTIFPFTSITLMSNAERLIFDRNACIPLGGSYIHYFRVYAKSTWNLEYEFPAQNPLESVNMNLLMLTPGVGVSATTANGRMKFHFNASDNEVAFLVFADKPFFPVKCSMIIAR